MSWPASNTVAIDSVHQKTHEGNFFSGGFYNATLANNGTVDILIQVTTQPIHAKFHVAAGADATVQIFEDTTFSAAGTAVVISNHNRSSAKVFVGTVTHTPTVTQAGTQINGTNFLPGGGAGSGSIGGDFDFANEFILDVNTNYLLRVTNVSGGVTKVSASMNGYQPNL